ncbi:MAG: A/G-specific adenine glycosylase [uncultured Chthoniobacterales bacterium]|uniref:Adenine DNA glycosylase n=1 Tax=uncultured Chthoniobacterales bacterium TaxID=1836801 RepID=A0A6J4H4H7_9BACT|nr:MAG: A/G-specific adenine glycosylase [uncultured Chthoniobacterales bacterium]
MLTASAVRSSTFDVQRSTFAPSEFRRRLLSWYRKHGRDLPWRHTRDPYAVLVSELMLQQTQVATVIPYYRGWLQRFPDFETLAAASESDVLHAWQGLGYYARARNLHAAAKAVVAHYAGTLPRCATAMQKLPGIGRYTANAVASFAFDQSVPIVEANTARLFARLMNLQMRIDSGTGRDALWQFASDLVPARHAGTVNSALMDLGAMICVPGEPKCGECPVRRFCRAVAPAKLPLKQRRAVLKTLNEPHQFVQRSGRVLLEQSTGRWRGMWILPRLHEPRAAARLLHRSHFPFTHHRVTLDVFDAKQVPASPTHRWFALGEIASIPVPSPHRRALNALLTARSPALN